MVIFSAKGSSSWERVLKADRFSPQMGIAHQGGDSIFPEGLTTGTVGGHSLARLQTRETSYASLSVKMNLEDGMTLVLPALKSLDSEIQHELN